MAEPTGGEKPKDVGSFYQLALGIRRENVRESELAQIQKVRFFVTRADNFLLHLFLPPTRHEDFLRILQRRAQEEFSVLLKGTAYPPSDKEGVVTPSAMVLQFISQPVKKDEPPVDMPALKDAVLVKFKKIIEPDGESITWTTESF
mgnify:CR=1 FL=1